MAQGGAVLNPCLQIVEMMQKCEGMISGVWEGNSCLRILPPSRIAMEDGSWTGEAREHGKKRAGCDDAFGCWAPNKIDCSLSLDVCACIRTCIYIYIYIQSLQVLLRVQVKVSNDPTLQHCHWPTGCLQNSQIVRAKDSPFVVKLWGSYQDSNAAPWKQPWEWLGSIVNG